MGIREVVKGDGFKLVAVGREMCIREGERTSYSCCVNILLAQSQSAQDTILYSMQAKAFATITASSSVR